MVSGAAVAKFALLREIYDLTRAQHRALEEDALHRFEVLLDERQLLIHRLQALAVEDATLPDNLLLFPGAEARPVDDDIALDTVLRGILDHDRQNAELLGQKMDDLRGELLSLAADARAVAGYRTAGAPVPRLDRRS